MHDRHSQPAPPINAAVCAAAQQRLDDAASLHFWCERCGERSRYVEMRDGSAFHPTCRQSTELGLYPGDPSGRGRPALAGYMREGNARVTETRRRRNAELHLVADAISGPHATILALHLLRPETPARHVIVVRERARGKESETDVRGVSRPVIDQLMAAANRIADPRQFIVEEVQGYAPRCPDCRCVMGALLETQHLHTCSQFDGHEMLRAQYELDLVETVELARGAA